MLTSKSYLNSLALISEASEYIICLQNNLEMASKDPEQGISKLTLSDIQSAADRVTATRAKIVNICASEVSDSTPEASE